MILLKKPAAPTLAIRREYEESRSKERSVGQPCIIKDDRSESGTHHSSPSMIKVESLKLEIPRYGQTAWRLEDSRPAIKEALPRSPLNHIRFTLFVALS